MKHPESERRKALTRAAEDRPLVDSGRDWIAGVAIAALIVLLLAAAAVYL